MLFLEVRDVRRDGGGVGEGEGDGFGVVEMWIIVGIGYVLFSFFRPCYHHYHSSPTHSFIHTIFPFFFFVMKLGGGERERRRKAPNTKEQIHSRPPLHIRLHRLL